MGGNNPRTWVQELGLRVPNAPWQWGFDGSSRGNGMGPALAPILRNLLVLSPGAWMLLPIPAALVCFP